MPILVLIIRVSGVSSAVSKGPEPCQLSPRGIVYRFYKFFQLISFSLREQPRLLIPPVMVQSSHSGGRVESGASENGSCSLKAQRWRFVVEKEFGLSKVVSRARDGVNKPREPYDLIPSRLTRSSALLRKIPHQCIERAEASFKEPDLYVDQAKLWECCTRLKAR